MRGYTYFIVLCWLSVVIPVSAQQFTAKVQVFDEQDGLSGVNLVDILQDSRSLIWIATSYGLNRFDGTSFKSFTSEESGLCHNSIIEIADDDQGNIWIQAGPFDREEDRCICILDPRTEEFFSVEAYTGQTPPFTSKKIGLSPRYKGTILLKENKEDYFQFYEVRDKIFHQGFVLPKSDSIGNNSTYLPAFKLDAETYITTYHSLLPQHKGKEYLQTISFDREGTILGVKDDLPYSCEIIYKAGPDIFYHYGNWLSDRIKGIYKNDQYIGTIKDLDIKSVVSDGQFIFALNDSYIKLYEVPEGQDTAVYKETIFFPERFEFESSLAFLDQDRNIWFNGNGTIYQVSLNKSIFQKLLNEEDEMWSIPVRGIDTGPDGTLYSGNMYYLYIKDPEGKEQKIQSSGQLNFRGQLGVLYDNDKLWIGKEELGIWAYDLESAKIQRYGFEDPKNTNSVSWMPFKSSQGDIWAGTGSGLFKLDKEEGHLRRFRDYKGFEKLGKSSVVSFHPAEKGTWLCTSSGLYLVDLETETILKVYNAQQAEDDYLPVENVAHMHKDQEGILWLATKGQGLVRWDPQTGNYTSFTKQKNGLSNNVLYAVYEDAYNKLWLPSNYGLMCFDKETHQVAVFLREDGIPHNEFNTVAHHQSEDGRLFFGTQDGLIQFHPDDFSSSEYAYPLILSTGQLRERVTDEVFDITGDVLERHIISMPPGVKSAQLRFALLNYKNPKGNLYSYQINPIQEDWIFTDNPEVSISGFPYGTYVLKFRGKSNSARSWTNYETPITIRVLRPFYLQGWFITLCILSLIGGIVLIIRANSRQLLARQRELEEEVQLRTAEIREKTIKLEAQDQLKSNFFANISHELRTPLALMQGPIQLLLKDGDSNARQTELLQMAKRSGKRLEYLIKEILDLRKLENDKMAVKPIPTDLLAFYRLHAGQFSSLAESNAIHYGQHIEVDEAVVVSLDQEKCRQVLYNLLSNAFKYTPNEGKIDLTVQLKGEQVHVSVRDAGQGIHPDDLPHLFDPYFQTSRPEKPVEGGTGIGLAICREYIELMGGTVAVESTLGEGTTFTFWYPVSILSEEEAKHLMKPSAMEPLPAQNGAIKEEHSIPTPDQDRPHILIVEDNPDLRTYIQIILQEKYKLTLVENGQLALDEMVEGHQFELIISDIMMPVMDGFQLLEALKSNQATRHIPVLMLTARAATADKLHALRIGVDDYMAKPFDDEELLVRIENLLNNYAIRISFTQEETKDESAQPSMSEPDREWLTQFEAFVQTHLDHANLSIPMLADEFAMSESTLLRQLKRLTGLTPQKYMIEVRMAEARQLIEQRKYLSIKRVAAAVGYHDARAFSRTFKKRFGKSPNEMMAV